VIEDLFHFLEQTVLPLGVVGVFLASVIEEVVAPIPSALIMMAAGFLFVSGPVDTQSILNLIFYVALPAGIGVSLGSLVVFYMAWLGGRPVVEKFGKWLGLSWRDVEMFNYRLKNSKSDEIMIVSARILPIVPSVAVSALCGFLRMGLRKYLVLTFTGMFVRGLILGAVGWQTGNLYHKYAESINRLEGIIFFSIAVIILSCIALVILRKYKLT
jgi:membrane protein DedA with SNARE-associated domain